MVLQNFIPNYNSNTQTLPCTCFEQIGLKVIKLDAFNTTSRYLDDMLNINNAYFDNMVSQIYPSELQLNKANASDTKAAFLDLHLSISNDIVSTKVYDKRDDFDFEIVNFPFLDGDVPCSTSNESISLNSFVLLEHLAMLLTSTLTINC